MQCRFAPNSSYFAYFTGKRLDIKESSVNLSNFAVVNLPTQPTDLLISPDSELIALLFKEKHSVLVFNPKGTLVAKIEDPQNGIAGILWAPDSSQLLFFSELLFRVSIYNLTDKSVSYLRNPKLSNRRGCVFSSNGKLMALLERHDCKDAIGIYHCGDWKMMNSITLESFDVIELMWAPNDAHIVAWENPLNYRLHAVCPFKGVVLRYQPYDYNLGLKIV
jgi:WD40 repeat protein